MTGREWGGGERRRWWRLFRHFRIFCLYYWHGLRSRANRMTSLAYVPHTSTPLRLVDIISPPRRGRARQGKHPLSCLSIPLLLSWSKSRPATSLFWYRLTEFLSFKRFGLLSLVLTCSSLQFSEYDYYWCQFSDWLVCLLNASRLASKEGWWGELKLTIKGKRTKEKCGWEKRRKENQEKKEKTKQNNKRKQGQDKKTNKRKQVQ